MVLFAPGLPLAYQSCLDLGWYSSTPVFAGYLLVNPPITAKIQTVPQAMHVNDPLVCHLLASGSSLENHSHDHVLQLYKNMGMHPQNLVYSHGPFALSFVCCDFFPNPNMLLL